MNRSKPVYCVYCEKWNPKTLKDQCKVEIVPGHPEFREKTSELNKNLNKFKDCVYYEEAGLVRRFYRHVRFGIPRDTNIEFYYK